MNEKQFVEVNEMNTFVYKHNGETTYPSNMIPGSRTNNQESVS